MIKVVNVYMSYGEYSIDGGVSVVEGGSIEEVIKREMKEEFDWRKNDCEGVEEDIECCEGEWKEFYNVGFVREDNGDWGYGEEEVKLYLNEESEWFEKIEGWDEWSDEKFEEWKKFIDGLNYEGEGVKEIKLL